MLFPRRRSSAGGEGRNGDATARRSNFGGEGDRVRPDAREVAIVPDSRLDGVFFPRATLAAAAPAVGRRGVVHADRVAVLDDAIVCDSVSTVRSA